MKPRRREQSTEGEIETETSWGWEGKKKKPKAKVDLKFRRCEGEMEIFFFLRDSETMRCELELSEVREVCVTAWE